MTTEQLQIECEKGQAQLMATEYLQAEATLAAAERTAWENRDWDTLSRVYMPLQEVRRQRRQRCGEGIVCLDLVAEGATDNVDPLHIVQNFSHGQLLVAGWGSIAPAVRVRELALSHGLFLDTFLAAVFPSDEGDVVAIIPLASSRLPDAAPRSLEQLKRSLPDHSTVIMKDKLPRGSMKGTYETYGQVMAMWEKLHTPFIEAADVMPDPVAKMEGYRTAIEVDSACELAHQKLSDVAREMLRPASRGQAARAT